MVLKEELSHQVTSIEAGMIAQIRYLTDWSEALDACGRSNAA